LKKHESWVRGVGLGVALFGAQSSAAQAAGPGGHWKGTIQVPGQELQVEVDLATKEPGVWTGTITIPVQNLRAFPLSSIEAQGNTVSFAMKGIPGEPAFKGRLSDDGASLSGDFTQGGTQLPFQLKRTGEAMIAEIPKSTPVAKELEGSWEGSLNAGGKVLRLKLKLENQPAGGATGSVVSVDQGGTEIAITTITQEAKRLKLELPSIGASYSGELQEGRLVGDWTQGAGTLPLVFARPKP
jgi:uncharacterized protein